MASDEVTRQRLQLTGAVDELDGSQPTVIFAPHFVGMDAGWTALTQQVQRNFTGIYTGQSNKVLDAWILAGRQRYRSGRPFGRADGVKAIVASLRSGAPLYLLPDMNFGPEESIFVPFYGVAGRHRAVAVALCPAGPRQGGAGHYAPDARRLRGAGAARVARLPVR